MFFFFCFGSSKLILSASQGGVHLTVVVASTGSCCFLLLLRLPVFWVPQEFLLMRSRGMTQCQGRCCIWHWKAFLVLFCFVFFWLLFVYCLLEALEWYLTCWLELKPKVLWASWPCRCTCRDMNDPIRAVCEWEPWENDPHLPPRITSFSCVGKYVTLITWGCCKHPW